MHELELIVSFRLLGLQTAHSSDMSVKLRVSCHISALEDIKQPRQSNNVFYSRKRHLLTVTLSSCTDSSDAVSGEGLG